MICLSTSDSLHEGSSSLSDESSRERFHGRYFLIVSTAFLSCNYNSQTRAFQSGTCSLVVLVVS